MKLHIKLKGEYPEYEGTEIINVDTGASVLMESFVLEVGVGEMPTLNARHAGTSC